MFNLKSVFVLPCIMLLSFAVSAQSNGPKATYRVGSVSISVWEKEKTGKYGSYVEKKYEVQNSYKKDGQWENTDQYDLEDLMKLRAIIDKAISEEAVKVKEKDEK